LSAGPAGRDRTSPVGLRFFTTAYRQGIVFREMKRIARELLELWRR
jgi:nicotinamide mononucleotide (NMN) deamidase PncC